MAMCKRRPDRCTSLWDQYIMAEREKSSQTKLVACEDGKNRPYLWCSKELHEGEAERLVGHGPILLNVQLNQWSDIKYYCYDY